MVSNCNIEWKKPKRFYWRKLIPQKEQAPVAINCKSENVYVHFTLKYFKITVWFRWTRLDSVIFKPTKIVPRILNQNFWWNSILVNVSFLMQISQKASRNHSNHYNFVRSWNRACIICSSESLQPGIIWNWNNLEIKISHLGYWLVFIETWIVKLGSTLESSGMESFFKMFPFCSGCTYL